MVRARVGPLRVGGEAVVIVLGIDTSTPKTSVALGSDRDLLAALSVQGPARQDVVASAVDRLLAWVDRDPARLGGVAVGIGPGLFTGLRVGVETAKTLSQVLNIPILGIASLDVIAYGVRHSTRTIVATIDARRGEIFWAIYRPVPGGVARDGDYRVGPPDHLVAELRALGEHALLVGNGAILYREQLGAAGPRVEFASPADAHPHASVLVELAAPRFEREEHQRWSEIVPLYLRRSDAEIAWDERARDASA